MTCGCYSKTNSDILLGKVCGECPGVSKSCRFSCLSGKQLCFVSWRSPFQHTAQFLPPKAPGQCCLSPASVRPEMLNVTWLWLSAASGGWRFTLIHDGLRAVLLSLSISSAFSPCIWTIIMSCSAYQRPCACSKAELCLGHMTQCPDFSHQKKRNYVSVKMKA